MTAGADEATGSLFRAQAVDYHRSTLPDGAVVGRAPPAVLLFATSALLIAGLILSVLLIPLPRSAQIAVEVTWSTAGGACPEGALRLKFDQRHPNAQILQFGSSYGLAVERPDAPFVLTRYEIQPVCREEWGTGEFRGVVAGLALERDARRRGVLIMPLPPATLYRAFVGPRR